MLSVRRDSVRYVDDTAETRQIAIVYVDSLEQRNWPRLTTLLAEDVLYEMPQTRERIRGRSAFLQFNMEYPGDWRLRCVAWPQIAASRRYGLTFG
jgi:hypothetical protein